MIGFFLAAIGVVMMIGFFPISVNAETYQRNQPVRLFLDELTQTRGFSLVSQDHKFTLGVPPHSLPSRNQIRVSLKRPNTLPKQIKHHSNQEIFSSIYSFDVYHPDTIWPTTPLWLKVKYQEDIDTPLTLASWDSHMKDWIILPSTQDRFSHTVSAPISVPYAFIAVLQAPEENALESGTASWYNYSHAAHRTLPFGTQVKVTNTSNGQSVTVEIGDRGPFIPGRVIDLPRFAFEQIASLGAGVIPVTIQIVHP